MQSKLSPVRFGRVAGRTASGPPPSLRPRAALKSNRLWDRMSWPVSVSLFAVPLVLALLTIAVPRLAASPEIAIRVTDRYTGRQIPEATLLLGDGAERTGPDGSVTVALPTELVPVTIQAPGYEPISTSLTRGGAADWQVALRPTVLQGQLVDAE